MRPDTSYTHRAHRGACKIGHIWQLLPDKRYITTCRCTHAACLVTKLATTPDQKIPALTLATLQNESAHRKHAEPAEERGPHIACAAGTVGWPLRARAERSRAAERALECACAGCGSATNGALRGFRRRHQPRSRMRQRQRQRQRSGGAVLVGGTLPGPGCRSLGHDPQRGRLRGRRRRRRVRRLVSHLALVLQPRRGPVGPVRGVA